MIKTPGTSPVPRAIAFDCYGTLLRITDQRRPYQHLARIAGERLEPSPMLAPLSLVDVVASNITNIDISGSELEQLQIDLEAELHSVLLIDDAAVVLEELLRSGFRLTIVSNLAAPYAEPARRLLGHLEIRKFSRSKSERLSRRR